LREYREDSPCPIIDIKFPFYSQLEKFFTQEAMRALNRFKRKQKPKPRSTPLKLIHFERGSGSHRLRRTSFTTAQAELDRPAKP
jgi:hypothetical protein